MTKYTAAHSCTSRKPTRPRLNHLPPKSIKSGRKEMITERNSVRNSVLSLQEERAYLTDMTSCGSINSANLKTLWVQIIICEKGNGVGGGGGGLFCCFPPPLVLFSHFQLLKNRLQPISVRLAPAPIPSLHRPSIFPCQQPICAAPAQNPQPQYLHVNPSISCWESYILGIS